MGRCHTETGVQHDFKPFHLNPRGPPDGFECRRCGKREYAND